MNIFFEPVNVNHWNIFDNVSNVGHVETFLATKAMKVGDVVLLYVGSQNRKYKSGVYAYGTVVKGPYILRDSPTEYCNNKRSADVRIDKIVYDFPLITHEDTKKYTAQFRRVHIIKENHYDDLEKVLDI